MGEGSDSLEAVVTFRVCYGFDCAIPYLGAELHQAIPYLGAVLNHGIVRNYEH